MLLSLKTTTSQFGRQVMVLQSGYLFDLVLCNIEADLQYFIENIANYEKKIAQLNLQSTL